MRASPKMNTKVFNVWKMEPITHECTIDKNICMDVLESIRQQLEKYSPRNPQTQAPIFKVANKCLAIYGDFTRSADHHEPWVTCSSFALGHILIRHRISEMIAVMMIRIL